MLEKWFKQILVTVGGVVLVLGWYTLRGPEDDHTQRLDTIPPAVWGGAQGPLEVRFKVNEPVELTTVFERQKAGGNEAERETLEAKQNYPAGEHTVSVLVPEETYAHVQLHFGEKPAVGAHFEWRIAVAGRQIYEHADTLEKPLEAGYAFFDNVDLDDVARAEPFGEPPAPGDSDAEED